MFQTSQDEARKSSVDPELQHLRITLSSRETKSVNKGMNYDVFVRIMKLDVSNVPRTSLLFHLTLKGHPMSRVVQGVDTATCAWCRQVQVHIRTSCILCSCPIFPVRSRLRHLHVVQLELCHAAKFNLGALVCIVVDH